jgi:type III restriction enzyme
MNNPFFERPILNSPYEYPREYWELDGSGQPTGRTIQERRKAEFITPIPKPRKQKNTGEQQKLKLDDGSGLSSARQEYEKTATVINELRGYRLEPCIWPKGWNSGQWP